MKLRVRRAAPTDLEAILALRAALWPDNPADDNEAEVRAILAGKPRSTTPLVQIVAELDGEIAGFIEVGLRSHADGCDETRPVGFIEGWYVAPARRRKGIGRALAAAAEDWCRDQGCTELASDTWIDNEGSQRAHEALGFEVVDRCVTYRKDLRR